MQKRAALTLACLAAGAMAFAAPGPAAGGPADMRLAQSDPFSALVGERRTAAPRQPAVERFVITADGRNFLFEPRGQRGRIKFLCGENDPRLDCRVDPEGPAEEIFMLSAHRGARGDVIYKNREGDTLLMIAAYGGATVFWPGYQHGEPASKSFGDDEPLILPFADRAAAWRRARFATAHLSALTGEPVVFDIGRAHTAAMMAAAPPPAMTAFAAQADQMAPEEDDDTDAPAEARDRSEASVLADAVARVAGGMQKVAGDPTGARYLGMRIREVRFVEGPAPSASLDGTILTVVYNPNSDLRGRLSSATIARFLEESL